VLSRRAVRRLLGALAAVLAGHALASVPAARAEQRTRSVGIDPFGSSLEPRERALPGGVVALRSPGSRMIRVPRSVFEMGSTPEDVLEAVADCAREPLGHRCKEEMFSDEQPKHRVTLSSYWLDRTEVTVADYARCVALRRCRAIPFEHGARRFDRPSFPASFVRLRDARAYCRFRGARLPTEAEFERAARGVRGRRYPWGQLYNSRAANHGRLGLDSTDVRDGFAELAPVGSFPSGRTPEGFLDLAGNVAEWVSDRYAPSYPAGPATDPQGPDASAASLGYVVRGGHFSSASPWLRGASRSSGDPDARSPTIGFRCAKDDHPVRR
jgi:formylglycine-generating enzyme required for sulfatase activity